MICVFACLCVFVSAAIGTDLLCSWNVEQTGDHSWTGQAFLRLTEGTHVLQAVDKHLLLLSGNHRKSDYLKPFTDYTPKINISVIIVHTSVDIHREFGIFIWQLILLPGQHILFTSTWPFSTFTTL